MKPAARSLALAFLFFILSPSLAHATSYYVGEVKTSDANPELTQSMKSLLTTAVTNAGGELATSESSADFILKTDLVKLGQAYVLNVTRYKGEQAVYSSRQKARSVEELDDAADRAVRAAMISKPAKKDLRVGEVKRSEEDEMRRRILSRDSTYFSFGPGGFANMGVTQLAYDLGLGHFWEVTPNAAITLMATGTASSDLKTYFLLGQLGLRYYLTDADFSPYVGGGLGFGGSASGSSSATTIGGFGGSIGLGLLFFRTSSTQFDLYASYSTIFGNNTIGAPGAFSIRIGILF
jgi:hypothetical protein